MSTIVNNATIFDDELVLICYGGMSAYVKNDHLFKNTYKGREKECVYELNWHNRNGPCGIDFDGELFWYIDNIQYHNTMDYCKASQMSEEETLCWVIKYGYDLPHYERDL